MDRMSKFVLPCYHSLFSCVVQARTKEAIIATDEHSTACGIERLGSPPWRTQWQRVNKNDHQLESSVMESIAEDGRRNRWVGNDNKKIRKRAWQKRGGVNWEDFFVVFLFKFPDFSNPLLRSLSLVFPIIPFLHKYDCIYCFLVFTCFNSVSATIRRENSVEKPENW